MGPALLALVLIGGCSKDAAPTRPAAAAPLAVRLAAVQPADGQDVLLVSGTVRLKRETPLSFNTGGRIAAIAVKEGDRVVRGQLLARLDVTSLDAGVDSARAEVVRAEADLARTQTLFDKGWVTAARLDSARAAAAAAKARLRQTGFDLGLAVLRAPTSGVVLARPAEPGQIVAPGQAVLSIGEYASGHVLRVPLADVDAARLRLGQSATVALPALGGAALPARVSEIGARGDDATGTFRIELALPDDPRLRSGLIGAARITLATTAQASGGEMAVPATAVFAVRADEGFVWVHDGQGHVRLRQVAVGAVNDTQVRITAGLKPGEQVATTAVDRLRDGAAILVAR
jgi:RND family efflux transporter MFP subunit